MPGRKAPESARREQILGAALRVAVRDRLSALRIRDVAKEAGLSAGLVLFHFRTKEALVSALLEWLLESTTVLKPQRRDSKDTAAGSLSALIRTEAMRLSTERQRSELFFDFWVAGTRTQNLRTQMRRALVQYRREFHSLAQATLAERTDASPGLTADGIAAAAVSFIHGCAMQAVIDPKRFDLAAALRVMDALEQQLCASLETHRQPRSGTGGRRASRAAAGTRTRKTGSDGP